MYVCMIDGWMDVWVDRMRECMNEWLMDEWMSRYIQIQVSTAVYISAGYFGCYHIRGYLT